ncbi:EcsC protein family protein [Arboricoccus pini]|uniref:EcsC protein family protein n=1 Tax=Arboricoccus pini TaxID=1963835 RepID=A0A212RZS4_9PROT|nr:EcsC family protein [Arboricoccus pini]SNB78173.1 EcsC protein family protein [Arboricoccus pini]
MSGTDMVIAASADALNDNLPAELPFGLPLAALEELTHARHVLEQDSLTTRLSAAVGQPIDAIKRRLPTKLQSLIDESLRRVLSRALKTVLSHEPTRSLPMVRADWLHRGLAAASGAAGGAFGLGGTLVELPVSTSLLLRQIAAEAVANGEDPTDPVTGIECLKVFAFGSHDEPADGGETGYFATRIALARLIPNMSTAMLPSFVGAITARFTQPVLLKLATQAAPVVGAAAGAGINLVFLEHFRRVARAHFTVRRLEREYGAENVRLAYEAARPSQG